MELELKGVNYRIAKLNVFDQLKVSRKLLPVLAGIISELQQLPDKESKNSLENALPKIAQAISDLSDEDTNSILYPCLSVVSRQHGKSWTPIFNQNTLAFDDIDLSTMLHLVSRVVMDSLGNFFQELHANPITTPNPAISA